MKVRNFQKHPYKILFLISLAAIVLLVSVLWFYGARINTLWLQSGNRGIFASNEQNPPMNTDIKFYIQSALRSLYNTQPVTDVSQQRVYFPEARFYVPLNSYARSIVYRFQDADKDVPASGTFTSNFNVNMLPTSFDDVPCLQRHVTVVIDHRSNYDGTFAAAVKLADGRTLNVYAQDDKSCKPDLWGQGSPDKLVKLLQQAKSY